MVDGARRSDFSWLAICAAGALSGAIGALVDWLIVASQFTQRGDVNPILPPVSLCALALGLVVGCATLLLTAHQGRPRGVAILGKAVIATLLALIGLFGIGAATASADITWTLLWAGPLALVVVPLATLAAMLFRRRTQTLLTLICLAATASTAAAMFLLASVTG